MEWRSVDWDDGTMIDVVPCDEGEWEMGGEIRAVNVNWQLATGNRESRMTRDSYNCGVSSVVIMASYQWRFMWRSQLVKAGRQNDRGFPLRRHLEGIYTYQIPKDPLLRGGQRDRYNWLENIREVSIVRSYCFWHLIDYVINCIYAVYRHATTFRVLLQMVP